MFGGKSVCAAIAASIVLFTVQNSHADYLNTNKSVVITDTFNLKIQNPWSDKTKAEFYDSSPTTFLQSVMDFINTESPAVILFEGKSRIQNPWPSATSRKIVNYCLTKTGATTGVTTKGILPLFSCISSVVFSTAMDFYEKGITQSGCVTHSLGVVDVVKRLGLRNVWANFYANSFGDGTFHVTNRIMFKGVDDQIYTYVLDNSSDPSALFPMNDLAINHHDRNNDGTTDVFELPDIVLSLK